MKADLKKYKGYTILFHADAVESGGYAPCATLFKVGEEAYKLKPTRIFADRDQALSFALGLAEEAVNFKLKEKKPDLDVLANGN